MEANALHELTAAYALDALDESEEREYEEHLVRCPECREQLAALSEAAASLAYGIETPAPPPSLRGRILDAAVGERPNVVPLRRSRAFRVVASVAAVAACAAVAFGVWSAILSGQLSDARKRAVPASIRASVAQTAAQEIGAGGVHGSLVVGRDGRGALVLADLPAAPAGKTYEAWVIEGGEAHRAGTFEGGGTVIVPLTRPVPAGATVATTMERAGGVDAPTQTPFLTASV
ncbi:MAG TPA: anti-sigma factor [Gaiellaceae bacterium]|jgi:anti-sigma-K factor RskA